MQVSSQDCLYLQGVSFVVSFGWNIIVFFLSISPHDGHFQHVIRHCQLIFTYALKVKDTELILGRQVKAGIYSMDSMACRADAIIFGFFSGERSQKRGPALNVRHARRRRRTRRACLAFHASFAPENGKKIAQAMDSMQHYLTWQPGAITPPYVTLSRITSVLKHTLVLLKNSLSSPVVTPGAIVTASESSSCKKKNKQIIVLSGLVNIVWYEKGIQYCPLCLDFIPPLCIFCF